MSTYVITGANRGIGLELCRQLHQRGEVVVALCRRPSAALEALKVRVEEDIDVADDELVPRLRARLAGCPVDVLVNNAGILTRETLEDLDFDRMRLQYEINSLGPLRVTAALLDNLHAG
ncbi:MAG: hypothetical protein DRI90_22230 [Deltaproteobacteria bacterium]|nr:MAG: hypothetical protein DRI90_22230 [Deltaproteobacteria bacterium]